MNIPILKIRDNDGNVISVPAIKGEPGFSPVIEISEIEGGYRVSITDDKETKSIDVLHGESYILTDADKRDIANLVGESITQRPTETKEFLNTYLYEPNADVSFVDDKVLLLCAGYDEQNDLSNKEIAKIEMNLDYENWVDVKDIIQIYPQFPYAINMNRSFLCTEKQNKTAVCFGVLGFVESGGNALLTDIDFHNQYGFRVTYYTD